ncbi:MAG: tRNA uridine-5-carboxymethylaminomethyl(34) synthesis GTPase MnmE [Longibaculum muris]|uniref:tRNA modification GTPase MnmE n=1 Tax=Longibaculum muris TaxID=1796628 RepID=A0A4R3YNK8_9FIRM|nr:tRNA uridine-5-carboxymethylaminomethyl(34) synthesis GTPase MnmE [Longibaculum muris]KXU49435.1 tRNA modification GTPase TrmE [Candidatus Stoquefichus sp. KLE1796]MBS5367909.1 tRNA uridine-5-carboxymethylaminomethyl(34) synthesis GTPase MnmE [Coprobacillus cateniformis]MCR1888964.1 tRNA uridine-5-carboxymethylaminomethyl(34) synthesis GTPase MnmE [Longibaculum muris]MED9811821.1 tRNA uridine-5-carboxymethylaminomethyl(34) synthesis GTPase MnmE [Longibaculum muris]TCV94247.1 tRNA modificati
MNDDIIVAIATSRLEAAISIIRLSGKDCIAFVQEFFTGKILNKASHTITYGYIKDGEQKIDEVLVNIYRGKRTFSGEEMVEINCHGGVYITQKVLNLCLKKGARMAEHGEFSKRAFLNGRIDLSQAEAISDLITAKNDYATELALKGIQGNISHFIEDLREDLIQIITQIEVNIDYPEYEDVEELTADSLLPKSQSLQKKMNHIIESSKNVHLLKDGISTVIIGKPNVGKSSLLNALLNEDKAIVTDIAGTTRDIVEGTIRLDNIILNMIDTAGIRDTDDIVENIGVHKSKELIHKADLVLLVIDGSVPLSKEDEELLELSKDTQRIIVVNKKDQGHNIDIEGISISARDNDIDALIQEIKKRFELGQITAGQEDILANARQIQLLQRASESLDNAIVAMKNQVPTDLIVTDLYDSWENLKEILGERAKEDLLDELFKRFCIGK